MFLTPEAKPIFGGTYWPPEDKEINGDKIMGFKSVLKRVLELDKDKRDDLIKQAEAVAEATNQALERATLGVALVTIEPKLITEAVAEFDIDPVHGGLGNSTRNYQGTKFPRVSAWQFLLQQSAKKEQQDTAKLVDLTLTKMAQGGIYDHLGGGFHRYSTERTWTVPHFEKMLYDQAQLVELYARAFEIRPTESVRRVITESLGFVQRELTAPEGYFYSALDADSNGVEGEFYVWTIEELEKILGKDKEFFLKIYAPDPKNFEGKFTILRLNRGLAELAAELKITEQELLTRLEPLKKKLFDIRAKRERPFLDTKLIVAWNGEMIAAAARAGKALSNKAFVQMAEKSAEFIWTHLRIQDGRLQRIYAARPGEKPTAQGMAFLDDYTYLLHGFLELHAATGDEKWLTRSQDLAAQIEKWFADPKKAGYFSTPSDGEKLFARAKDGYDGAQPSGNGLMTTNLVQLWLATKNTAYRDRAVKMVQLYGRQLAQSPTSVPLVAFAADQLLAGGAFTRVEAPELPVAPANPKSSADVVKVAVKSLGEGPTQKYEVSVAIARGWHIYANPVGMEDLEAARTQVDVLVAGQPVPEIRVQYPQGTAHQDQGKSYQVYEQRVVIMLSGNLADAAEKGCTVRIKLTACNDKSCLLPATIKVDMK
jgi:uncharacterized protein YyaL (SSP411 family)